MPSVEQTDPECFTGIQHPTPAVSFRLDPRFHALAKRIGVRLKSDASFADRLESLLASEETAEADAAAMARVRAETEATARRPDDVADLADRVGQLEGAVGHLESAVQHLSAVVESLASPQPGRKGGGGAGGKAKGEPWATTPATTDPKEAPAEAVEAVDAVPVPGRESGGGNVALGGPCGRRGSGCRDGAVEGGRHDHGEHRGTVRDVGGKRQQASRGA